MTGQGTAQSAGALPDSGTRAHPGTPYAGLPRAARRAASLTLAALWWEETLVAFWPAASVAVVGPSALALGTAATLPPAGAAVLTAVWIAALTLATAWGTQRFRRPTVAQALTRVDARLPGRPLFVLQDRMATGGAHAAVLWRAHQARARRAASGARPVGADAGLTRRDPLALRLAALTAAAMALLFGGPGPARQGLAAVASTWRSTAATAPVAAGPAWEGWAQPPGLTGRPTIYLNALAADAVELPQGTRVTLRLYDGRAGYAQDIGAARPDSDPAAPEITAQQSGTLAVGDRRFAVTVLPDAAPTVRLTAVAERRADGRLSQGFAAEDDHGVVRGRAEIALDLPAVDRRYGLAVDPEPRPPVTLDLPLPGGRRPSVTGTLAADLAQNPWANMPVTVTLTVEDGLGQTGRSDPQRMVLPGRRFFDPLAAALAELRRDILWSAANASRSAELLRAAVWQLDGIPAPVLTQLKAVVAGLESAPLQPQARDELAAQLWQAAVAIEDGGLGDALERMRKVQQRLSEAMRRGASKDEIRKLMDELRAATDAYTELLAEREDPAARFDRSPQQGRQIDGDQIRRMMDAIQRLMDEGRTAEPQELLDQFQRMMQNLQVRPGEGERQGKGQGGRAMDRLAESLRRQQRLADESLREAQRNPFGDPGEGQDAEGGGAADQPGASSGGQPGGAAPDEGSLAERQRALRENLERQRGLLPGRGTAAGDEAGRRLRDAGRAMGEAEQALREGDAMGALERQADAIEGLREGMRQLGQLGREQGAQGRDGQTRPGQGDQPGSEGAARPDGGEGPSGQPRRDPLGRDASGQGAITTDGPLAEGPAGRDRARGLQDEIRRRAGEPQRPRAERDYLGRLLEPD